MYVRDAVLRRESCRAYADRPVEREKLVACLEAVRMAPSACNSQPWRLIAVQDVALLARLRPCMQAGGMNRFIDGCGTLVALIEEPAVLSARLGNRIDQQKYAQIDVGIAAAHFCLRATELGLSTCILGWLNPDEIREVLELREDETPRLVLAVGYADSETLRPKKRRVAAEVYELRTGEQTTGSADVPVL